MTGRAEGKRSPFDHLNDDIVDDFFKLSDEEALALLIEIGDDPTTVAADSRALFEQTMLATRKTLLVTARASMQASREGKAGRVPLHPELARQLFKELLENAPQTAAPWTLAARNQKELTDSDIQGIVENMLELGLIKRPGSYT